MRRALALILLATAAAAQQPANPHPRDSQIHDPDTLAWWHTTEALSGDDMEGRDTGSAAYLRAAKYVAQRFLAAGLQPAGDSGTFFQQVPMHEVAVDQATFTLTHEDGSRIDIPFLQQITLTPALTLLPATTGALTFRGYCGKSSMADIAGKFVLCFGTQREGLPTGAERAANARAGKALGLLSIDDPFFTIEPPRWPAAYARTVTLDRGPTPLAPAGGTLISMRISSEYSSSSS